MFEHVVHGNNTNNVRTKSKRKSEVDVLEFQLASFILCGDMSRGCRDCESHSSSLADVKESLGWGLGKVSMFSLSDSWSCIGSVIKKLKGIM